MWNTILFDLDGTLTDPKVGITKAVAIALDHFGIQEAPDNLTHFIGPPLDESFSEFYGFTPAQIQTATEVFREYYVRQGWLENVPYPGMDKLLRDLKAAGKHLMVATSKPKETAVKILEHFGMAQYFDRIFGAPLDNQEGAKKVNVIRNALSWANSAWDGWDYSGAVMVGDRRHDVEGAHANRIPAIGVSCTNPQVTLGNDHYFRVCFLDPFQGTVLANLAVDEYSAKKAYILTKLGDDYSVGVGNYFKEAFEGLGGSCVVESFQEGNSDFTSYITTAKNEGCDICLAPISVEALALFLEQANTQGLGMPVLGGDTLDSNVVAGVGKGTDLDIYCSTFYAVGGDPEFDAGFTKYMEDNATALANNGGNTTIAACSVLGYDAYYVALEALKAAGSTDKAAVKAALPSLSYTGVSGAIAFDGVGDAVRDTAYIKTADNAAGAWTLETVQTVK